VWVQKKRAEGRLLKEVEGTAEEAASKEVSSIEKSRLEIKEETLL
jgi:uncharacterized protein YdcH (DUF465 family)